jgi:hypothetical protein
MFMRVRRTLPQFTFILSERFVNQNSSVSTGFFRFSPVLFAFGHFFCEKTQQNEQIYLLNTSSRSLLSQPRIGHMAWLVPAKFELRIQRGGKKLRR